MTSRRLFVLLAPLATVVLVLLGSSSQSQDLPPQPEGVETLARGPVHEAFAQPMDTQPEPPAPITKQPPDPIEELPPDQKPEGDNVQWIPGYWAWDVDSNDFLWVSGCWRGAPPNRRWLPGHWQEIDQGWLWVAGFWTPATAQDVQYLPPPPPTLEKGPVAPAPNDNTIYAPGCWVYQANKYLWRPGHWVAYQPNWVWIPAHYVWTPGGCLFIDDYWDHPLDDCGLLFAPIRFDLRIWTAARRSYVPQFVIGLDFLMGAMFVDPAARHFCFGDYFDDRYVKRGFVAWTDYHPSPGVFDPHFSYYRRQHAAEPGWETGLRELYRARLTGAVPRPPRTLALQVQSVKAIALNKTGGAFIHKDIHLTNVQNVTALVSLKDIHNTPVTVLGGLANVKESKITHTVLKLETVSKDEHAREVKVATQLVEAGNQRRQVEATMLVKGGIPVKHTDPPKTVKLEIAHPPAAVVAVRPVVRTPPAVVVLPKHEERPIPKYEPPHPPAPPKEKKKG
jgi:hypothetical protein